ncbi:hypothetical protein BH23CHL7_BH23CHL7_04600 [soil metagenome]
MEAARAEYQREMSELMKEKIDTLEEAEVRRAAAEPATPPTTAQRETSPTLRRTSAPGG